MMAGQPSNHATAPEARGISFAAIVLVPFALVMAVAPSSSTLAAAGILGFVLVAIIDAGSGAGRLRDLEVSFPATVRLTKDRAGQAELVLKWTASVPRRLRLGLAWPKEFGSQQEEMEVQLPEKTERATLRWPVTPLMRGSFGLGECFVEALSPLGLWSMRTRRPISCELRVFLDYHFAPQIINSRVGSNGIGIIIGGQMSED